MKFYALWLILKLRLTAICHNLDELVMCIFGLETTVLVKSAKHLISFVCQCISYYKTMNYIGYSLEHKIVTHQEEGQTELNQTTLRSTLKKLPRVLRERSLT